MSTKGPVIIYHLGGGGGGRRILGDHLIFSRIQGGTTQICLDNARHRGRGKAGGGGGVTKVINSYEGGINSMK